MRSAFTRRSCALLAACSDSGPPLDQRDVIILVPRAPIVIQ